MTLLNDSGEIRRLARPLLRHWWFVLFMCCLGAYKGYNSYLVGIPSYQARATIQVNDKNSSPSVFLEHFESFSMVGEFLLELEFIRSTYLIRKAIKKIPLKVGYWKREEHGWKQRYKNLPFELAYTLKDSTCLDIPLFIEVKEGGDWEMRFTHSLNKVVDLKMKAGESANYKGLSLTLDKNSIAKPPEVGSYQIIIRSEKALLGIFADLNNLMVRLQDEHVALINIYYWHAHPAIATDFVNALARTYIENFLERKKEMANRALGTIEDQIDQAEEKLEKAENELFTYRDDVNIWKLTSSRKLHSDILKKSRTKKLNTTLKIKDLENLSKALDLIEKNPENQINYGSVRDMGYQDAINQIGNLQKDLKRSRLNLTEQHPKIIHLNQELKQAIKDLQSRIKRTLGTNKELKRKLDHWISVSGEQILGFPKIEQNLNFLLRKVAFRQRSLDSLNITMVNAYISSMSNFTFHRILEHELAPEHPIKPLIEIKIGVTSLVYTLLSIFLLLFLQGLIGVLKDVEDVEEHLELPVRTEAVLRNFPKKPISQGMINLATDLILDQEVQVITLFDFKPHVDKFQSSYQLAYVLAELEQKTLLINFAEDEISSKNSNLPHPMLDILQAGKKANDFPAKILQHRKWGRTLSQFCKQYDYIIFVMQGIQESQDALTLMMTSDLNLYAAGLYRSKISHLKKVQQYLQYHKVPNTELLLLKKEHENYFSRLLKHS